MHLYELSICISRFSLIAPPLLRGNTFVELTRLELDIMMENDPHEEPQ